MLPGLKSMLNYHPLFVHFPIALWFAALLYEALAIWRSNDEWHRTAVRLLYLGTLAAFVAAFTGWLAESSVSRDRSRPFCLRASRIVDAHHHQFRRWPLPLLLHHARTLYIGDAPPLARWSGGARNTHHRGSRPRRPTGL